MLIDIDEIVVEGRIRKDFGDIEELASNIRKNGLLNPLTVNGDYKLLAGERRLRACRLLGWSQVDVRVVRSDDEVQDLEIEMSENNLRRNFTGSELADGLRRKMALESEKAKERMQDPMQTFAEGQTGTSRDKAAEQFGISGEQARKTLFVDDNRDLLDPADFADWDEGKLSTNKAFQRIKAAQAQAERDRRLAEQEADRAKRDLADAYRDAENLEAENDVLKRQLAERPKPEVIEREVVREVVPDDYEALKRRVNDLRHDSQVYLNNNKELRRQLDESRTELEKVKDIIGMDKGMRDVQRDVRYLADATNQYIRRYAGLTWTAQQFSEIDDASLEQLRTAVVNLATFSSALVDSLENEYGRRHGA